MFDVFLSGFAMLAAASATPATMPELSLEQRSLVRCSAAFAIVAHDQSNGIESAQKWPDIQESGRKFFVHALVSVMDDTGYDRETVAAIMEQSAKDLRAAGEVDKLMPACLVMLENSGVR